MEQVIHIPPIQEKVQCPKCKFIQDKYFPDAYAYIRKHVGPIEAMKELSGTVICPQCKERLIS